MDKKLSTADLIIVIAGAAALLGSFLPWVSIGGFTRSAWSDGAFPTYTWVGILGALMAAHVLVRTYTAATLPASVLGFSWNQIHFIFSLFALVLVVSFLVAGEEYGIGFWLSLLGAAGLVVGARMEHAATTTLS